ncbi:Hsp70 family protein, partial [Mycolicibacterium sp.]|uniref:Hsp70 family protein n=1 Tax=Mycolicibacterium sp. TaxID=2320850 RepID=UPI001A2F7F9C
MSNALGLSIGTTNLVAACPGRQPVARRSVLTLWGDRPAEVGVPSQNPELTSPNLTQAGVVLRGFVERVGDPVPLVAADGSSHRGDNLVAAALDGMARTVDDGITPARVVIAAPAHWGPATVGALRGALRSSTLSANGVAPVIISDATAALSALQAEPGLPARGVIALCDVGSSGTSITLARADLSPIGETLRVADFSGDKVDQALLDLVLARVQGAGFNDPGNTSALGALTRLREQCRLAKERLSSETVTVMPVDLPGYRSDVTVTRAELESLLEEPINVVIDALGDALERNSISAAELTAVATVGGGAAIPVVSQRLSDAVRVPVITTAFPTLAAATGAALIAMRGAATDAPTGLAPTVSDAPTGLAPTALAPVAAGHAANESSGALAWSQDDGSSEEPVPYTGGDYTTPPADSRPTALIEPETETGFGSALLPWYRRPPLLFGIAAALAAVTVGGLAITLTSTDSTPTTTTTRVTKPGETPSEAPVPETVTVTGSNGEPTVSTVTPTTTSSAEPTTTTSP